MQINFLYHILISGLIFYVLTAGAKMYLKLRGSLDFSYLGIVIFGSYAGVLAHMHRDFSMLSAFGFAFVLSLFFTIFVLYLSEKLEGLYFTIGTLTLYMLFYQAAFNLESITGGAFGLSGMSREVLSGVMLKGLVPYLWMTAGVVLVVIGMLMYFQRTYVYTILQGRGEREIVIKSLGVRVQRYKMIMIGLTTFLAVLGGNLYAFYYLFIDPVSFWVPMLVLLLVLVFATYRFNEIISLFVVLSIVGVYEGLRFFKLVDPSQIGYFREIVFACIVMIASFWVFRTTTFGRET